MEAGYDYLLLRGRLQRRFFKYSGIFVLLMGVALLATGGAYYGYAAKARANLDNLNVSVPGVLADQASAALGEAGQGSLGAPGSGAPAGLDGEGEGANAALLAVPGNGQSPAVEGSAMLLPALSAAAISNQRLYPGESLGAASWSNPLGYEPPSYREQLLLQGFTPVELGHEVPGDRLAAAERIIVPSIGVDSEVSELAILNLSGSRAYETPDNVVGHIPETANAGEAGSSWFFGHTESPTMGEGSVFFDLRKIPDKLRAGEEVFIITDNGQEQYLYRATSSQVVQQDDMRLYDTGRATIHLVSCVPRLVYDHRLVVTGELIAWKGRT
jgi:LPXTG-site transpeptidase (sortase) family protein